MGDNEDVPAYVTYTNGIVKESLDGVSAQIERMSEVLATKAEVKLLEYKLEVETQARVDADTERAKEIAKIIAQRAADEAERKAKGRRVWGAFWALGGIVATAAINQMIQLWNQTH